MEAKKDEGRRQGQRQAELYADCLEEMTGQRPVIFYTNGYEPGSGTTRSIRREPVQGFLHQGRIAADDQPAHAAASLWPTPDIDRIIVDRYYHEEAIRRIMERFDNDNQRKALVVMATGTGKTRTTVALVDQLMKAGWAQRVLFLADRTALLRTRRTTPSSKCFPTRPW